MSSSSSPFNSLLSSNNPAPYDFSQGDITEQAHAPGLDANNLLSMSQLADFSPPTDENYGDFSLMPLDLQTKMNTVIAGQQAFDDMPSKVHDVFHTAGDFLQFVDNLDNLKDNPEDSDSLEAYNIAVDLEIVDSKYFPKINKFLSPPETPPESDT